MRITKEIKIRSRIKIKTDPSRMVRSCSYSCSFS